MKTWCFSNMQYTSTSDTFHTLLSLHHKFVDLNYSWILFIYSTINGYFQWITHKSFLIDKVSMTITFCFQIFSYHELSEMKLIAIIVLTFCRSKVHLYIQ